MSARVGLVGGFLALTALEAVLSTKGATGRVSGLLGWASSAFERIADPTVPAIPDRSGSSSTGTATSSSFPLPAAPAPGIVTT